MHAVEGIRFVLGELDVARRHLVHGHVAGDMVLHLRFPEAPAAPPDHHAELDLVVELAGLRRMNHVVERSAKARDRLGEDHRLARRRRILEERRGFGDVRLRVRSGDQHLPRHRNGRAQAHGFRLDQARLGARGECLVEQAPPVGLLEQQAHVARRHSRPRRSHGALEIDDARALEDAGALLPFRSVGYESHVSRG